MQCLNIKNPEVAALLKEYTEILGSENAAYYVLSENNGYGIDKAPNGEPSKLFSDLLEHYNGDRVAAIQAKARTYSESFKDWFGDWVNPLKPGDIIFGHPAIGKTYSLESGKYKDKIIDWDVEFNEKRDKWIEDHSNTVKGTPEYKKARNEYLIYPENHPDYVEFLTEEWERVKNKVKKEGKILFASPHNLLKMFPQDFNRIINLKDDDFIKRNIGRGGKEKESKLWKEGINETISNTTGIPVEYLNENQYFEDYLNKYIGVSKVVDENGEPLVVYHHSSDNITDFSVYPSKRYYGSYFSLIPYKEYGVNQTVNFLSIKNPYVTDVEETMEFGKTKELTDYIANKHVDSLYDGMIGLNNLLPEDVKTFSNPKEILEIVTFNPNQVKSIDNQGTFSTQDNNIYNQEAATQNATGRNKELALLLREIYPNIEIDVLTNPNLRGQAQVEGYMAGRVLLNAALENQDTLPHEYAHHYIAWFRNAPIVQRGIKQFGSEEVLVQAIGENSVKALKWYNRFFNWIKGLFNEKQDTLNEITKAFLSGRTLGNSYFFGKETHNQKAVEVPEAINNIYDKLMSSIHRRMKDIQYSKYTDPNKLDELRALEFRLNQLENDKATLEFIDYMDQDINSALDETLRILSKVKEAAKYGNDHEISNAELDLIKKGYIGFYNNIATNLQNMLDDDTTFDYFNNEQLINDTKVALKRIMGNYAELVRNFNNVVDIIAKDNFIKEATKAGSYTVDQLKNILEEGDLDINLWDQWIGSTQYSNSELVRIMMNKIIAVKNAVADEERIKGKELLNLLDQVDKAKLAYFHEKTKDGHKTGFMTRDLNYGEHYQKLFKYQRDLADKLGFGDKDISEVPGLLNKEQLKTWNTENNKWHAKYSIRRFIPEYYELTNSLSEEARTRRDTINMEINLLLNNTRDENGDIHRELLSDEDYGKLQELENSRRNLANPFYADGTTKAGLDLEIAREMQQYNEKLRAKLNYKPNMEKYNKAKAAAKKNLSPELFKKWEQRNSVERIKEEFWEDIKMLSSNPIKSDNQVLYENARKNLLKLYAKEDGTFNTDAMPENVKSMINTYDVMISDEAIANRDKSKKSRVMEIAKWEINPKFYEEFERMEKQGEAAFNAWFSVNARYTSRGDVVPASFWRKLVPKDEFKSKYIERIPNRSWAEIDRESPFYDPRFTKYEDRGETVIPNPKYFDNSAAYKKITSDPKLKTLYDALVDVVALANSKIGFLRYANKYKLPQIEGGSWTQIRSKDNFLKGIAYAAQDLYTVKDDDDRYMIENAKRSDGSLVKLIPTRYIKMLDNPDAITNDVVGSIIHYYKMAVNYEKMSEAAPELELALDFVSRMDFKDKKGGKISGVESKTYDKMKDLMDRLVYGMEKDAKEVDVKLPKGKHVKLSIDKLVNNLAAYTRIQGISQNLNVILTGLITNKIQNRLEAMSGIYFGNEELAKATKTLLPAYADAIKNIGKANNKNKVLCYLEFLGVVRDNEQTFSKLNQSRLLRALNQHYWYFGHEIGDIITKGKLALSVAFFNKYDPETGKFVNKNQFLRKFKDKKKGKAAWNALNITFFDAFEVKNNQLVVKPEYANIVDERTINKIKNTTKQIATRIDTQLTDLDKSKLHSTLIGQLLLIYRNFILVNLQTKFLTKRQFNYSTGMWSEAQIPAAFSYLGRHWAENISFLRKHFFDQKKIDQLRELYKDHYDELDDYEKGCLKRVTYEFLFSTLGFWLISSIIRAMADEDRDNWWKQEAAYLTLRASLETRGNVLPIEVFNMLNTPTAAWSTLQYWGDLTTVALQDPTEEINKGPYRGLNRLQRSLIKATPLRSIYEARDPRSKLEYYDNLISIF
nr:MAG: ADP-ribosyltransferase [Bacteriophage sp.]